MSTLFITLLATISTVKGQQFDGYTFPHDLLGLSLGCFAVVNRTVSSCPAWLPRYAGLEGASVEILPSEQLTILCESSCRRDLGNLRTSILGACTASSDVMVPNKFAYPATFLVDRFLYAASLSCLKDKVSGKYCDAVVADWVNQPNYTNSQTCSQCELGVQQIQLGSPFGFSDTLAQAFADTTKSCSAANYGFATPTSYALNATTLPSPPACIGSAYTIKENDTCVTISGANDISTYQVITTNKLNLGCDNLPGVGRSICLPTGSRCRTYQLGLYETCETLMMSWNVTLAQVQAWNPMINSACSNLASWRGWYLCSSSPSGIATVGSGNTVTTIAPVPTNAQDQSNTRCGQWYYVEAGDNCAAISLKFSLALSDFYFLNPQVDSTCRNLRANTSYCVKPVGNIETYSRYPTSTAATTFTRPVTTSDFVPSPVQTATLRPKASGTTSDCYMYENAFDSTSKLKNLVMANSCSNWANFVNVTVEQLVEWNPSLSASNCVLQAGKSYCVQKWRTPPHVALPYDYCVHVNRTRIPALSVQPSECSCYTIFRVQDKANFNCSMVPNLFNITVAELTRLNPWIGSECDTGIWSQLTPDGYEQVCVLKSSARPTGWPISSTTTTSMTATETTPPAPTQPGASKDCKKWHKIMSGDDCWSVAKAAGISLDAFYRLNPGVGSDCRTLWLGYAVCIGE
ncbi:hypothetical protein JDV02_008028 [Purpureocillium takamizusanense]|uniref:LysM domain-containing protein n=1 Tax=Purpureocillium takamizusanense TaxID=2060973 RepID=A0A9Q8QMU1_9HYPO|nr:uncharacterized protein JDV02_008028 [Purpureocillium takamizusanense]UNI22107.1 hypothetical protein JDV02_008028 [Purpureocillium takamizusanense]